MPTNFFSICQLSLLVVFLSFFPNHQSNAENISIPLKTEFSILENALKKQLFNEKNSTELLKDPTGCSKIVLTDAKLGEKSNQLIIDAKLTARLGVEFLDQCMSLRPWDGFIQLSAQPFIKSDQPRKIYLKILHSKLVNTENESLDSGAIWEKVQQLIHPLFDQYAIDLTPSINELNSILQLFLTGHSKNQLESMLASLQIGSINVVSQGLETSLTMQIEPTLSTEKLEKQLWQQKWQTMDAILSNAIKQFASATQQQDLKLTLLDILLDFRYQLQSALQIDSAEDPVKHWFIESWTKLIPVINQIHFNNNNKNLATMLFLVTATDALAALDKLGPIFGLDISINGLRRLARHINANNPEKILKYNENLDPELIKLFPPFSLSSQNSARLNMLPIRTAYADPQLSLNDWLPSQNGLHDYLLQVRSLLLDTAKQTLTSSDLTPLQQDVFTKMILTTAWQESCWRQFSVKKNTIVPLTSASSDVGIMQINEIVWRGFVDRQKLRWDISYNAKMGSKILLNYMTRYAIRHEEFKKSGGLDNLARSAYSSYNGGPSQYARYRKPNVKPHLKKIDVAFYEKFIHIKKGDNLAVSNCFIPSSQTKATKHHTIKKLLPPSASKPALTVNSATSKSIHNEPWIKQQNKQHFTLQLGVFSSKSSANSFIHNQAVMGNYATLTRNQNNRDYFVVVYGYYSTKKRAIKEKKYFSSINPWVRQFKEIY